MATETPTMSFLFGLFDVLTNSLQAMGAATASLVINLGRRESSSFPPFHPESSLRAYRAGLGAAGG